MRDFGNGMPSPARIAQPPRRFQKPATKQVRAGALVDALECLSDPPRIEPHRAGNRTGLEIGVVEFLLDIGAYAGGFARLSPVAAAGRTESHRVRGGDQPATIHGFEAEYTINPVDGLVINGSVGYTKFKAPDLSERTVNRRQNDPFWTANAGVQYTIPVDSIGGDVTPRLDWIFQSSEVVSGTTTKFNHLLHSRSLVNARVSYDNKDYDFTLAAGFTNLFDKKYFFNVFDSQAFGAPYSQAQPGPPRCAACYRETDRVPGRFG